MPSIKQVIPQLWQLKLGTVNAFLYKFKDILILVDTGWPNQADIFFKLVSEVGQNPMNIKHIVLTHGHIDHAGSAAELKRRTGARVYAHSADLDLINNGRAEHAGTTVTPGIIPFLIDRIFIKPAGDKYESFEVDQIIKESDVLTEAGNLEVIHTPGHSAGHVSLLMKKEEMLIAGDICSNVMGLGFSIINEDRALARNSVLKISKYRFKSAVFGHGDPLLSNANQKMEKKFLTIKP